MSAACIRSEAGRMGTFAFVGEVYKMHQHPRLRSQHRSGLRLGWRLV